MNNSFDSRLKEIDIYKLHPTIMPFIGDKFETYKILQVGESHYIDQTPEKEKYDIEYFFKWWDEPCQEVLDDSPGWVDTRGVMSNYINEPRNGNSYTIFTNFIKTFSEVVIGKEISSISMEDKQLYQYIAFMNFFQMPSIYEGKNYWKSLEISSKKKGNRKLAGEMWNIASRQSVETLDRVIEILEPKAVIITSISAGETYQNYGGKHLGDNVIITSHPGYPFTWWKKLKSLDGKTGKEVMEQGLKNIYKC